jgi:hypothetical protein
VEDQLPPPESEQQRGYRSAIRQKIVDSIARPMPALTLRDAWLPRVSDEAIAVIGMRRAGKTSLLWQIMAQQLVSGTPREALVYFSFEDERLAGMAAIDLQLVVEEYFKLYPQRRDRDKTVFLLDEIQLVTGWESFVRRILDTETITLYLSGSSAKLLSREIATSMRGRALEAIVTPLAFEKHCATMPHYQPIHMRQALPAGNGPRRSALPCTSAWCNTSRTAVSPRCKACSPRKTRASA